MFPTLMENDWNLHCKSLARAAISGSIYITIFLNCGEN